MSFMVGSLHTSGYLLVWTIHYQTLNEDVNHKLQLIEEMKERVGFDQGEKYSYETDVYVHAHVHAIMHLCIYIRKYIYAKNYLCISHTTWTSTCVYTVII